MSSGRTIRKIRRAVVEQLVREGVPPMGAKASFDAILAEVERAAAEKAYEQGRLDERHDCNLTSLYHGSVISAEQLQRDLRSGNPYRAAALGLTAEQEREKDE